MTYNDLKAAIDTCHKEIMAVKKALKQCEEDKNSCKQALDSAETSYQYNLRQEKDRALQTHIDNVSHNFEEDINNIKQQLSNEQQTYEDKLKSLESSGVTASYSNEEAMTAEVRSALAVLQEQLEKSISHRFQVELESQLDCQTLNMQPDDVEEVIKYFNKQSRILSRMEKPHMIDKFIDWTLSTVRLPTEMVGNSSTKGKVSFGILSVIIFVAFILASKYVFPVYVLLIFVLLLYNIGRNYKIFSALTAQKAVKDNLTMIEDKLHQKAVKALEKKKAKLQQQYDEVMLQLQGKLDELENQQNNAVNQAKNSFEFDDSIVTQRYQSAMKINNSRMQTLQMQYEQQSKRLCDLQKELSDLENQMNEIAGGVQESYLDFDKVGDSVLFDNKFIIDVKNARPVYFIHPKGGTLFLYEQIKDVYDFVKLLLIQLRIKLNPTNLQCGITDTTGMGIPYLPFALEDTSGANKNLFQIFDNQKDSEDYISFLSDIVTKRIPIIRKTHDSIDDYNRSMQESDSMTEAYNFAFLHNPTQSMLEKLEFNKIYINGGSVGVYMHVFISSERFREMKDLARNLIEGSSGIFVLKDNNIRKKAKEFAMETLIKVREEKPHNL